MKKSLPILISIFISTSCLAQDFGKKFAELFDNKDTAAIEPLLSQWATAKSTDPELFIAYFNYYVYKSKKEIISIEKLQKGEESIILTDTGRGKPVAFLNSSINFDSEILQRGFNYIDQGIALNPTRLDMRFGKIYMLGKAENYKEFTKTLIETLEYGDKIDNAWLWKEGKSLKKEKDFLLNNIQDYINTLYETEDDDLLPYMREISESVLKYYPNHVESLSNIAITYLLVGENHKALPFLLKAETINGKDVIVLNNIAETYKRKGDKEKAKIYFEKIIKYGNKDDAEDAKEKIKKL